MPDPHFQLLKNSESGTSSGAAKFADEDAFEAKNRRRNAFKKWRRDSGDDDEVSGGAAMY